MKKYLLEIVVFICGAAVMIFELAGSRLVAPYLGTSLTVWTSLIGIILGSLSIGCWYGGKLADKNSRLKILSRIVFLSGIFIGLTAVSNTFLLSSVIEHFSNIHCKILFSITFLFAIPSIFLGMVSPYATRLKLKDIETSGKIIGNLYAISTVGSIFGTFLAGFFLIPFLGTIKILYITSAGLILVSFLAAADELNIKFAAIILLSPIFTFFAVKANANKDYIDIDTQYSRIFIKEGFSWDTFRPTLDLVTGPCGVQSAIHTDNSSDLTSEYTKYYGFAEYFTKINNALMIGGGGFSYPKYYLKQYPKATIDVVEIDAELIKIAQEYFNLKENNRLNIHIGDGRMFLNKNKNKYDAIFIDAFDSNLSIPWQLTTVEAAEKMRQALNKDGVLIMNMVSAIEGEKGKFLRAEYASFKKIFNQVYIFSVKDNNNAKRVQNIILIASKKSDKINFTGGDPEISELFDHLWEKDIDASDITLLTDNRAPVDYYTMNLCNY